MAVGTRRQKNNGLARAGVRPAREGRGGGEPGLLPWRSYEQPINEVGPTRESRSAGRLIKSFQTIINEGEKALP